MTRKVIEHQGIVPPGIVDRIAPEQRGTDDELRGRRESLLKAIARISELLARIDDILPRTKPDKGDQDD